MTQKQRTVLRCLLESNTQKEAAKKAHVSENTVGSYLRDREFLHEYQEQLSGLIRDANRQLKLSLTPAISALTDIVQNTEESSGARIQASKSLLDFCLRYSEFSELSMQLETLEKKIAEMERSVDDEF